MFRRARLIADENGGQVNSRNRYSSKYLLSNLLVCGNCGAGFRRRTLCLQSVFQQKYFRKSENTNGKCDNIRHTGKQEREAYYHIQ